MKTRETEFLKVSKTVKGLLMLMRASLMLAIIGVLLVGIIPVVSFAASKSDRIRISYESPENPAHLEIAALTKERRTLERLKEFLSPFQLPRRLTIEVAGCHGEADAFYEDRLITICYEYIQALLDNAPRETTASGVERYDAVAGPLVDTTLHEFAHALFDMLKIPVLGGEEDAADQVSAYIYLQLGYEESRRLIAGTAYAYLHEAVSGDSPSSLEDFADEHSTPAQRAYNVLCMAYGADSKLFANVVGEQQGFLPMERAMYCEEEYERVQDAYEALIEPYLDQAMARKNFDRAWLKQKQTH